MKKHFTKPNESKSSIREMLRSCLGLSLMLITLTMSGLKAQSQEIKPISTYITKATARTFRQQSSSVAVDNTATNARVAYEPVCGVTDPGWLFGSSSTGYTVICTDGFKIGTIKSRRAATTVNPNQKVTYVWVIYFLDVDLRTQFETTINELIPSLNGSGESLDLGGYTYAQLLSKGKELVIKKEGPLNAKKYKITDIEFHRAAYVSTACSSNDAFYLTQAVYFAYKPNPDLYPGGTITLDKLTTPCAPTSGSIRNDFMPQYSDTQISWQKTSSPYSLPTKWTTISNETKEYLAFSGLESLTAFRRVITTKLSGCPSNTFISNQALITVPPKANNTTSTATISSNQTKTLVGSPAGGKFSIVSGGGTITGNSYKPDNSIKVDTKVTIRYTAPTSDGCTADVAFTVKAPCAAAQTRFTCNPLPNLTVGKGYTINVQGGEGGNITWDITPKNGVSISSGKGNTTGSITYSVAGNYRIIFTSTNTTCSPATSITCDRPFTVSPPCVAAQTPLKCNPNLPTLTVGKNHTFDVQGGEGGNITWDITPKNGVSISSGKDRNTGNITFSVAGDYKIIFTSTNTTCSPAKSINCAQTFTVVKPAMITATPDEIGVSPSSMGQAVGNVRANDRINGVIANTNNSTIAEVGTWPQGITLITRSVVPNSSVGVGGTVGAILVRTGTRPGNYNLNYQLCDLSKPAANCATGKITLSIAASSTATSTANGRVANTDNLPTISTETVVKPAMITATPDVASAVPPPCVAAQTPLKCNPNLLTLTVGKGHTFDVQGGEGGNITWDITPKIGVSQSSGRGKKTSNITFSVAGDYKIIFTSTNTTCSPAKSTTCVQTFTVSPPCVAAQTPLKCNPNLPTLTVGKNHTFDVQGGEGGNITWDITPKNGVSPSNGIGRNTGNITFSVAGNYNIIFTSTNTTCSPAKSINCAQTFTVVKPAMITATPDEIWVSPSSMGQAVGNVRANDRINGVIANTNNSTIAEVGTWPQGITLITRTGVAPMASVGGIVGAISVRTGTRPGNYNLNYQLCDLSKPAANCATGNITLSIAASSTASGRVANTDNLPTISTETVQQTSSSALEGSDLQMSIYPNPVTNELTLKYFSDQDGGELTIDVVDMQGLPQLNQKVTTTLGLNVISLDLTKLKEGIYTLKTLQGNKLSTKKIIKAIE